MPTAKELLGDKNDVLWTVTPASTVYQALETMAEGGVGAVLVMSEGNMVGIFSERDYARKVVLKGKTSRDTTISDVMTAKVLSVAPDEPLAHCMAVMTNKRVRHLPVLDEGELVGVISIGDVVKKTIAHQEFLIEQLESYISGG